MLTAAFYDTRSYDRTYFENAAGAARVDWRFHDFRLSAETASTARGVAAVCIFVNDRVDRPCIEALSEAGVKLIALRCAGFNNVDLVAAKECGIPAVRVPAYSPYAVAEHTVALLMTLNRKIHRAYNRVRDLNFSLGGLVGFDLHGKTVGIVGTGRIGRITAEIFGGFGTRILACDRNPSTEWAAQHGVTYTDFHHLLGHSDVVSLHLPLTPDSHYLMNEKTIGRMKPGAHLINTSRGKLIDTSAVIDALKSGHLGGVGLDVYEEEEGIFFEDLSGQVLKDDELSRLLIFPNVLVTSHQAFLTHEALSEIARVSSENLVRFEDGQPFLEGTQL